MRTGKKGTGWSQLWKRNAVVAAIALFVCAAVYLNWNYEQEAAAGNLDAPDAAEPVDMQEGVDPLLREAIEMAVQDGQTSISMLQRRMRIGYARAGRLIDEMSKRGIISQAQGAKPRQVLISREELSMMDFSQE